MKTTLLEQIKQENELRFFFQNERIFFIHYYPNILEFQNKIAEVQSKMESNSMNELKQLKLKLTEKFTFNYIEYAPALYEAKYLNKVDLTLREHLFFIRELLPLYQKKEKLQLKIHKIQKQLSFQKNKKLQEILKKTSRLYALCLKRIERKEKRFPMLKI